MVRASSLSGNGLGGARVVYRSGAPHPFPHVLTEQLQQTGGRRSPPMGAASRIWTGILPAVVWGLLLVPGSSEVYGQTNAPGSSLFVPAPRSLRQNLLRAQRAIAEERFSDAVAELGVILSGTGSGGAPATPPPVVPDGQPPQPSVGPALQGEEHQDFFIEVPRGAEGTRHTSLKQEAQRLLGTMPAAGRELYELQFGSDARVLLDRAVRESDLRLLNEVIRQYFHTKAGYEATLLLARLHLDRGQPLAAAICLRRLHDLPGGAPQYEPELSLLLAASWHLAQQPQQAQAVLGRLPPRFAPGQLQLGDTGVREVPANAAAWLSQHFRTAARDADHTGDWPLFRGNPERTASRLGGVPLRRPRWQVTLAVDEQERELVEDLRQEFVDQAKPVLPVVQPLAVGNTVVMRSSERLVGINFQTGKRVWEYPFWDLTEEEEPGPTPALMPPQNLREMRLGAVRERLWQDAAFGQVSSDGRAVYLLDGKRGQQRVFPRGFQRGFFPMPATNATNKLVALDLQREGYLLWEVGGDTGGEETRLAGALFLGPPLPLFGQLFAIVEIRGEVRLVVLDAATGRQEWSQQLVHMEASFGLDEWLRRISGLTPSFADGVLVCPTSAGGVVALDVATRSLLWGYQYGDVREPFSRNGFIQQFQIQPQSPIEGNRWCDATVTLAEGKALLTPVDSNQLICLDLLTGQPAWPPLTRQQHLENMLYVAGIHQGAAILVGRSRVTAIRMADGKTVWDEPCQLGIGSEAMPSGRGFLSGNSYFLPTTDSQLVEIDLTAGKVARRTPTDHVLGNLICFQDDVVSVSADRATTFYQVEPLRRKTAARLATAPRDAWALARSGELLIHDGKTSEAIRVLQQAQAENSSDLLVKTLLVDTYLNALRERFADHVQLAGAIEPLLDRDAQRLDFHRSLAIGRHQAGDLVAAARDYAKVGQLIAAEAKRRENREPFSLLSLEPRHEVRSDRFLAVRLHEIWEQGPSEARDHIEGFVDQWKSQLDFSSPPQVRNFLHVCGFHPHSRTVRLQFADRLLELGEALEAEYWLAPLLETDRTPEAGAAWAVMARLYESVRRPVLAAQAYERCRRDWKDVPLREGKTGGQLADEAAPRLAATAAPPAAWPWGLTRVTKAASGNRTVVAAFPQFPLLERRGTELAGQRLTLDAIQNSLQLRDPQGVPSYRLPMIPIQFEMENGLWRTAADRHLLFFVMGSQIVALDTLRRDSGTPQAILWRETLVGSDFEVGNKGSETYRIPLESKPRVALRHVDAAGRPQVITGSLTAAGACFQRMRTIECVTPLTGTTAWSRHDFEPGCTLFGDHEFLFVVPPSLATNTQAECWMLSVQDGRTVGGKKKIPVASKRWTTRGRTILACEEQGEEIRLYLYDAARESELWSEKFPSGSRGCLIDNEGVAVVQPDGRLVYRSLVDSAVRTESQLEATPTLESIEVHVSAERLLVIVNDREGNPQAGEVWNRPGRLSPRPVNGRLYAVARDGKTLWQTPAEVRGFALLPEHPVEVPVLWFLRHGATNPTPATPAKVDVLCLDPRTGTEIYQEQDVTTSVNAFDLVVDPRKHEASLLLPHAQFTVTFTSEPRPPAPTFQSSSTGNRIQAALESLGGALKTLKDSLGN